MGKDGVFFRKCGRGAALCLAAAALAGLCACKREPVTRSAFALDTLCAVTLYDPPSASLAEQSLATLAACEARFSAHLPGSEVSAINEAGGSPVPVSQETAQLIALGIQYAGETDGLFDIAIGPLSAQWNFHGEKRVPPDAQALREATAYVDARRIRIETQGDQAYVLLPSPESRLDLGGVAKGWISDVMADELRAKGVKSAIVNLGGNVVVVGSRPDGKPFSVGIQAPFTGRSEIVGTLQVRDASVVTAGIYERCFEYDGELYHHILDPRTGYPAKTDLLAASILCERGVEGDLLSTSCLLLGEQKALALLRAKGAEAVLIRADGSICLTDGLKNGVFTPEPGQVVR